MYYIIYPIFYLLSLLPWRFIYFLSDCFYVLVYYVFGYRKSVVFNNLRIAFPDKTEEQRIKIAKDFYHQLVDSFIEIIKLLTISKAELNKRFTCNYEVVNDFVNNGQKIQLHGGHFFNWEFVNLAYGTNLKIPFLGVYMPLKNKIFDKILYDSRGKFGTVLIPAYQFKNQFHLYNKDQYVLGLAADQNAGNLSNAYWVKFFGKMVPFVTGPERGAVSQNTAVIFATYYKVKRGYYASEFKLYTTNPNSLPTGKLTLDYRDFMEEQIRLRPSNYLWTHKRWKHHFDAEKYGHLALD